MKIVCENCGAKYSIADEKVKGKVFKIRCKKCSESILVRGDSPKPEPEPAPMPQAPPEEEGEAETRVFDYAGSGMGGVADSGGAEPIWHIVVDDQQQGPYTEDQIREYIGTGSITSDTLIWREGFDDWMMVQDVPELGGSAGPASAPAAAASASAGGLFDEQPAGGGKLFDEQPAGGGLFGDAADTSSPFDSGGGLFGDSAGGGDVFSSTTPNESAAASGGLFGGGQAAGDGGLFAAEDARAATAAGSGEGIFSSTKEEPVAAAAAAPGPRVSAEQAMLTGQRNENSVLFSLSNLQALAAAPAKEPGIMESPTGGLGAGGGEEASGLIDIRSLAGSINTAEQNDSVDDLISMSAGGFAPALGAPVLAAQNEGMSTNVKIGIIAGGVAFLLAIVVLVVALVTGDDEARTQNEAQIAALQKKIEELSQNSKGGSNDEAIAALQAQLKKKQEAANDEDEGASKENGDQKDEEKTATSKSASKSSKKSSSSSRRTASKSSSSGSSKAAASSSSSSSGASKETASAPSPKPKASGSSELDDLLGGATSNRSRSKSKSSASSSKSSSSSSSGGAKAALSRADVQKGMANVAPAVKRCGQGKGGTITMNVMIGKTGRVSSASAVGAYAGTPIGSCAARAVRRARFPASQQSLNVKYPFKL